MEVHGSRQIGRRQEIRCPDCGHAYVIAEGQLSSRCTYCGNISTHANARSAQPEQQSNSLAEISRIPVAPGPLERFHRLPDGLEVQAVLSQYQIEWQLWAALVKNFGDPVLHSAYLSQAVSKNLISQASERYRAHGAVMALASQDRWQAEVSDLMLTRLESLSFLRLEQTETSEFLYLRWLALVHDYPLRAKIMRFAWIVAAMAVVVRLCFYALGWR